jgi:transcriptional regulator with XRE-family HTH domain
MRKKRALVRRINQPETTTFAQRFSQILDEQADVGAFAQAIGVSEAALYHYAAGRRAPSLIKLAVICRVAQITSDWLLGLPAQVNHRLLRHLIAQAEKQEAQAKELRELVSKHGETISHAGTRVTKVANDPLRSRH